MTIKNEPQLSAEMEKRFDELFVGKIEVPSDTTARTYKTNNLWKEAPYGGYETMTQPYQVKAFLATALEEQKSQYIKQVKKMPVVVVPRAHVINFMSGEAKKDDLQAVDVSDVLAILNGKDTNE